MPRVVVLVIDQLLEVYGFISQNIYSRPKTCCDVGVESTELGHVEHVNISYRGNALLQYKIAHKKPQTDKLLANNLSDQQ